MSPFFTGLLAGGAQALTTIGTAMFSDAIDQRKQERLQAIRDKEYDRARRDQLADYQRARTDQLADIDSQRKFQKGLLTDERIYQDRVRSTEFGQQVALQTLSEAQQKRLIEYGQKFPQSQLGKLIQERDRFEPGSDQYNLYQQQINQSQLIQNTNPYTGAISIGIPQFDESGRLTGVEEVATFGGMADLPGSSAGRTPPEPPEIDQAELKQQIDMVEGMQADENGMIDLGRGPISKQQLLQRLRGGLTAAAPPGSTSRFAFNRVG